MRWTLKPKPDPGIVAHLEEVLGVENSIAWLLAQRGIETFGQAKKFFRPSLDDLHDPFLMKDMNAAVDRLEKALLEGENILVYGDYDVDGTTSVALVSSFLKNIHPNIATYIPDRYDEGYGISVKGIDFADDNDISLIIALDCGIKESEKIKYAAEKGIDFIICDHHRPGPDIPEAAAVLDPKREDCLYPYKELSGCGVGFKLLQALAVRRSDSFEDLIPYLDLVAVAIGADMVPVTGENRILAFHGLRVVNAGLRPGFKAILEQVKKKYFDFSDIGFIIAPRINAAGRMKHGQHAVNLLIEKDDSTARRFAAEIEIYNSERKAADRSITEEALQQIEAAMEQDRFTTVVYHENWHKGVIGIVASRLTETYYRPTLVFTKSGKALAASARSVAGFDVYNALEGCQEHLEQFGGHTAAAGLTLLESELENFKSKFEEVVSESISKNMLTRELLIDMKLELAEITPKFFRVLKQFEPFGPGNPVPLFLTDNLKDSGFSKCVGSEKKHLKCRLTDSVSGNSFEAIGFKLGDKLQLLSGGNKIEAVYHIDQNHWRNQVNLQLNLKDIR